jgi:hypothetical protein
MKTIITIAAIVTVSVIGIAAASMPYVVSEPVQTHTSQSQWVPYGSVANAVSLTDDDASVWDDGC